MMRYGAVGRCLRLDAAIALSLLVCGCGGYDDKLLPEAPVHAVASDGGGRTVGSDAGGVNAGSGGVSAPTADAGPSPGGRDAGATAGADAATGACAATAETCNGLDDDCDDEVDEDASAECAGGNANAVCSQGACLIVACLPDYRDCDGQADNGCEVSITEDPAHCGACGAACSLAQTAAAVCGAGMSCQVGTCDEGYANCDDDHATGCETLVRTTARCGGCEGSPEATKCEGLANVVTTSCATGLCRITECAASWHDCDGDPANGCEVMGGPMACGCDPEGDVDGDGSDDCADECDDDPNKVLPGMCGCGLAETDGDTDGVPDCIDLCDTDPGKSDPGQCGCGVADSDGDGDGTADCRDGCPTDPTVQGDCFPFTPSNFDSKPIDFSAQPSSLLDCGNVTIDTTDPDGGGPLVASITGWCGTAPTPLAQTQTSGMGPEVVVIPLAGLNVASGRSVTVVGTRPLIFAVRGNVTIAGSVTADANGNTPGAGGNWSCTPATESGAGANGVGQPGRWPGTSNAGASGGGGGGFGTAGGRGGRSDTDNNGCGQCNGGNGGATRGSTNLVPLVGGCPGGRAGGCSTDGGAGGGALQITAAGTLRVSGTLHANGGAGATPCGANDEGGGTGGGSGGALLLEANSVDLGGASFTVHGAQGGKNGNYAGIYNCGGSNGGSGSTNTSNPGGNGAQCQGGGSGGGGGYGRRHTRAVGSCTACP